MNELSNYIDGLIRFTESEKELFVSLFKETHLKKNEYLAKEGEYSTKLAFLTKGVMRAFYRNSEGNEYNKTFFTNANFVGAYSSLITGKKNLINIQCLTDCTLQVAVYAQMTKLYSNYPTFESLGRRLAEYKFAIKEKREIELVTLNATERYEIFRKEHPKLENTIPQYHIASYLGITPTQLSRIRAQK